MLGLSNISNLLEKVIAPAIESQLFEENFLTDWLRKNSGVQKLDNNEFYITVIKSRNPSIGFIADTTTNLDTQTADITSQVKVSSKYGFGTLRFDDRAIEAAKSDKGAIKELVSTYSEQLKNDLAKDVNRQFFLYGNGRLCLANGAGTDTTTVTVDTPGTEYLDAGMNIIIGSGSAVRITSVDSDTQITIAAARSWSDNAVITRADADGVAASEMMGLGGIVDDGGRVATLQTIARSTNPWWKAYLDTTAEALAVADMQTAYHKALKYAGKKGEFAIITGQTLYEKYGTLLTATQTRVNTDYEFSGGWKGLSFMGGKAGVYLDFDCPEGEMYFIDRNSLTTVQLTPVGWMPGTNGVLTKVAGSTLWEAVLRFYGNLAVKKVRSNAALRAKTA